MKTCRMLVLWMLALGIPLQGFASVSLAFCRMAQGAAHSPLSAQAVIDHSTHLAFDSHGHHAMHSATPHDTHTLSHDRGALDGDTIGWADALHQCGQCAHCVAAHAMASFSVTPMSWPEAHPVWVSAVPKLHGRTYISAPERPPRALTA